MREALAERLLAQVMQWTPEDVARERPLLQAMAAFKYDEYQQFAPGMRFVESLALWLNQFRKQIERKVAYEFVKKRLVYISNAEMSHFVSAVYPDHIRPVLIKHTADTLKTPARYVRKITQSNEYRILRRRCLFLGLSDSARIDVFRRSNHELSNEQIWQTYELPPDKAKTMHDELVKDLKMMCDTFEIKDAYYRMIFLLDDFSGSGRSYLREEESSSKGKIVKFLKLITNPSNGMASLVNLNDLYVGIVLYVATEKASIYLNEAINKLFGNTQTKLEIKIVQHLPDEVALHDVTDRDFLALANTYYDQNAEDKHTIKGGTDLKRGFASCSLPVVLNHNTPNNSVFLLWADPQKFNVRGLFPRFSRHRSEL